MDLMPDFAERACFIPSYCEEQDELGLEFVFHQCQWEQRF